MNGVVGVDEICSMREGRKGRKMGWREREEEARRENVRERGEERCDGGREGNKTGGNEEEKEGMKD